MKNEIIKYSKNEIDNKKDAAWSVLSENTQKAYQYDYNLFFDFMMHYLLKKNISDVNEKDIYEFIRHLENNEYKHATINRKIASLSKMFSVLVLAGEIEKNPVEELKKIKNLNFQTSKEVHISLALQDIKKAIKNNKSSTLQYKRISLIIKTLATTGLRVTELINIKHKDLITFENNIFSARIIGKGKKERYVYIHKDLYDEILKLWSFDNDYIFYNKNNDKYCRKHLWREVKKRFKDVIGQDIWPHLLRHFFITHKISIEKQDIKAVSKYVGHSDISTTLKMYVDTSLDAKDSQIKI